MNKHRSYILAVLICLLLVPIASIAQDRNISEVIDVVRPYKPILADPLKIKNNPEISDNETLKPDIEYRIKPLKLDSLNNGNPLPVEKMKAESIAKLYRLYVKAGIGTYLNNVGELYYNNIQNKEWLYGLHIRHLAGDGILANSAFSEDNSGVYAKKIFSGATWGANVNYNRNAVYHYGYNHSDTAFIKKDVRQRFNTFSASTQVLTTNREPNGLNFGFSADAYNLYDIEKAAENGLKTDLFFDRKWFKNTINLPVSVDISEFNGTDTVNQTNLVVKVSPTFAQKTDSALSFKIGATFAYEQLQKGTLHFYPLAHVQYVLVPRFAIPFGGIRGDLQKQSYRGLSTENPFIKSDIILRNQNEKITLYGGVISNPGRFIFKAQLNYSYIDNLVLFVTDSTDSKRLAIVYDGKNGTRTNFIVEASYQVSEKLRLNGKVDVAGYNTVTQIRAWHKPQTSATATASYSIAKKFVFQANVFYIGNRDALINPKKQEFKKLNAITDLNLDIEYRYSKTLSIFSRFSNITASRYERWLDYPAYGFNFIAGLTFAL